jgi:hypothetical protein
MYMHYFKDFLAQAITKGVDRGTCLLCRKFLLELAVDTHEEDFPRQTSGNGTQGNWRAAIYNPMRVYKMAYNLSAEKHVHCLNNCSQNGKCTEDGQCKCHGDWAGGDCSIDLSTSCVQGTRKAIPK